jgi:hypothetical protein
MRDAATDFRVLPIGQRIRAEARWIRKRGLRAWLTWATMDEASGKVPLRRSARFWRRVLRA